MEKKYVSTIILEHDIEDEDKNSIFNDLTKRLLPKGQLPITVDSITIQEAPAHLQPTYYKKLIELSQQYQQALQQQQQPQQYYEEPQQPREEYYEEPQNTPQPQEKKSPKQKEEPLEQEEEQEQEEE